MSEQAVDMDRRDWVELQSDLENQLTDAQTLNDSMQAELDKIRTANADLERDRQGSRRPVNGIDHSDDGTWKTQYEVLERRYDELKLDLQDQQQVSRRHHLQTPLPPPPQKKKRGEKKKGGGGGGPGLHPGQHHHPDD